jgi:tetratricopeptide (TPR) repeat protein
LINDKLGTTTQKRDVEIIYVKNKNGEFDDLENAMLDAKQGYDMLVSRPDVAKGKLQSAIDAWEAALAEGDMDDKKARINKKVVPDLYKNLILAYTLIGEFDKADDHYNDSLRMGFNNGDENDLKEINLLTADLRERYQK